MATATDHATQAVDALRALWQKPHAGHRPYGTDPYRPIADGPYDQPHLAGVANPLWDVVRWMPAAPPLFGPSPIEPQSYTVGLGVETVAPLDAIGVGRHHLCKRYAWSIVTPGDVTWMCDQLDGRPVVEVGAGTGYWAWQLQQAGVNVAAYDIAQPGDDNTYCTGGPYTTVLPAGPEAAATHPGRALLMVWPPYGGEHARHALAGYGGDLLLYAGESAGGCTADGGFYELLDTEWVQVSESPRHVTWAGIHCSLGAYRRK